MADSIPILAHFPREQETCGTTLVAVETADGIVVGTDSRTSKGTFISSRVTDKITPLNEQIVLLRAGSTSDSQAIADIIMYLAEANSIMDDEPITVYNVAQYARKFHYNYREQLSSVVIVAGYDDFKQGQIYAVSSGGYTVRQPVYISGSGSTMIHAFIDANWHPGIGTEEAVEMVKKAVYLAQVHDGMSGGVIHIGRINKDGTNKQIFRPDKPGFPEPKNIPFYPNLPEHIPQPGFKATNAE